MSDKTFETRLKILEMPEVEREIKLLLILEMAYHGDVSLAKAKELCTESELFSDHWVVIDAKATDIFSKVIQNI